MMWADSGPPTSQTGKIARNAHVWLTVSTRGTGSFLHMKAASTLAMSMRRLRGFLSLWISQNTPRTRRSPRLS